MLDGFIAAIVAGPATYEPLAWLCPLLGVTKDAINDGTTDEYAALAATAAHHNALSTTLSETPKSFTPLFERDAKGDVEIGPWCRGFHAAIQLNPKFWRKLLPVRGLAHLWLIPILAHCDDDDGRPVHGAPAARSAHRASALQCRPRNSWRRRGNKRVLETNSIQTPILIAAAALIQNLLLHTQIGHRGTLATVTNSSGAISWSLSPFKTAASSVSWRMFNLLQHVRLLRLVVQPSRTVEISM